MSENMKTLGAGAAIGLSVDAALIALSRQRGASWEDIGEGSLSLTFLFLIFVGLFWLSANRT